MLISNCRSFLPVPKRLLFRAKRSGRPCAVVSIPVLSVLAWNSAAVCVCVNNIFHTTPAA
ncbi:hypothetical protein KCP69_04670 [Salmonella enterica subsp. enterica]|nr:hypothetical protein KCP69_04670 [Salmonella enterica subsp. enterica]